MSDKELKLDAPTFVVGPSEAAHAPLGYAETGSDNAGLRETFGYEQEMPRSRGLFNIITMMLAMASVPYGLATTFYYPLVNGGAPVVFWGWILNCFMTFCLAVSLGEISSKYPVSGGVYYWSYVLSPPKWAPVVSWITGWLSLVGNITVLLAVNYGDAAMLLAAINIFEPDYVAKPWHQVLATWGLIVVLGLISMVCHRWLPRIDDTGIFIGIAGVVAAAITLSVKAASGRRTAREVFVTLVESNAGWPRGWGVMVGALQGSYTCSATGMLVSMAEEVRRPELNIARGMVYGNLLNAAYGLLVLLPILFTLGDLPTILSSVTGQLLPNIYLLATGSEAAAFTLFFIVLCNGFICSLACTEGVTRCIWAFARDGGIPGKRIFGKVSPRFGQPINAFLLHSAIQILLCCINFGSTAAFNAFASVAVISLGSSYIVPVFVSLFRGRRAIRGAPFYKGKFGLACNIIACGWALFTIPLYSFPTTRPVTLQSMNYASVVWVGFGAVSVVWYFAGGRGHFSGPPGFEGREKEQRTAERVMEADMGEGQADGKASL